MRSRHSLRVGPVPGAPCAARACARQRTSRRRPTRTQCRGGAGRRRRRDHRRGRNGSARGGAVARRRGGGGACWLPHLLRLARSRGRLPQPAPPHHTRPCTPPHVSAPARAVRRRRAQRRRPSCCGAAPHAPPATMHPPHPTRPTPPAHHHPALHHNRPQVTFLALYRLLDFGGQYDAALRAGTQRGARETMQFGVLGMHLGAPPRRPPLAAWGLAAGAGRAGPRGQRRARVAARLGAPTHSASRPAPRLRRTGGKHLDRHFMKDFSAFSITTYLGFEPRVDEELQPGITISKPVGGFWGGVGAAWVGRAAGGSEGRGRGLLAVLGRPELVCCAPASEAASLPASLPDPALPAGPARAAGRRDPWRDAGGGRRARAARRADPGGLHPVAPRRPRGRRVRAGDARPHRRAAGCTRQLRGPCATSPRPLRAAHCPPPSHCHPPAPQGAPPGVSARLRPGRGVQRV